MYLSKISFNVSMVVESNKHVVLNMRIGSKDSHSPLDYNHVLTSLNLKSSSLYSLSTTQIISLSSPSAMMQLYQKMFLIPCHLAAYGIVYVT